jgi:hypothetical protein
MPSVRPPFLRSSCSTVASVSSTAPEVRCEDLVIQYHGWNDPPISPLNSTQYYDRVVKAMGGPAKSRCQLSAVYGARIVALRLALGIPVRAWSGRRKRLQHGETEERRRTEAVRRAGEAGPWPAFNDRAKAPIASPMRNSFVACDRAFARSWGAKRPHRRVERLETSHATPMPSVRPPLLRSSCSTVASVSSIARKMSASNVTPVRRLPGNCAGRPTRSATSDRAARSSPAAGPLLRP